MPPPTSTPVPVSASPASWRRPTSVEGVSVPVRSTTRRLPRECPDNVGSTPTHVNPESLGSVTESMRSEHLIRIRFRTGQAGVASRARNRWTRGRTQRIIVTVRRRVRERTGTSRHEQESHTGLLRRARVLGAPRVDLFTIVHFHHRQPPATGKPFGAFPVPAVARFRACAGAGARVGESAGPFALSYRGV